MFLGGPDWPEANATTTRFSSLTYKNQIESVMLAIALPATLQLPLRY
jgi:hypothetical protein